MRMKGLKEGCRLAMVAGLALVGYSLMASKCETPLDEGWIECEGIAATEQKAIDEALKQGISMVFGVNLSAVDLAKSLSAETTVETPEGQATVSTSSESMQSETLKQTAGSVKQWKKISVTPHGADLKAHVHALIVNPRVGIEAVIMVAPPTTDASLRTEMFSIGPKKRVSGREICQVVEGSLCSALSGSKKFKICSFADVKKTAATAKLSNAMVGAGLAPSSELMEAGKVLTADYVLTTKLESLTYKKTLGMDKVTKKFGPQYKLKVVLGLNLTNVRQGTSAGADTVTLSLENQEIAKLLEDDEDADLLRTCFGALVDPLRGWIKKNVK